MRIMGIDYGTKRVGIALTDDKGMMAFPYGVLENTTSLQKDIEKIIATERVEKIVIGHSIDRNGVPNKIHDAVEALMLDLTLSLGIPIELEPEQYSTQEAMRYEGKKNALTDASAASIILNSYIMRGKQSSK
jgi:putative holliday junction resolvase